MFGIGRRFQRIERDMARTAGHPDEERRLDRSVEQVTVPGVGPSGAERLVEAFP
jgi:hypothetical protein